MRPARRTGAGVAACALMPADEPAHQGHTEPERESGPGADAVERLRAAGCVFAEEEAALLREAADGDGPALEGLVSRRVGGEPLEQVLGWVVFRGLRYAVGPGVFVPRARTEFLVQCASDVLDALPRPGGASPGSAPAHRQPVVVDLCCGCGAIGAAIGVAHPGIELHAADISPAATALARANLAATGALVHTGDLFDALPGELLGQVDLLVANAPYVPSDQISLMPREAREHEPREALDGGPEGTSVHSRIARAAPQWLAPGGSLLLETSPPLAEATARLVTAAGLVVGTRRSDEHQAVVVAGVSRPR